MSTNAWDRQHNDEGELEPMFWFKRFRAFCEAGPGRSLLGAYKDSVADKARKRPITSASKAWKDAAALWNWRARAEAYDVAQEKERQAKLAQERAEAEAKLKAYQQRIIDEARADTEYIRVGIIAPVAAIVNKIQAAKINGEEPNITPAEASLVRSAAKAYETNNRTRRLNAGLPGTVNRQEATGAEGGPIVLSWEDIVQAALEGDEDDTL